MRFRWTWLPCALAACGAPEVAVDTPPPEPHVVQYVAQSARPYVLVIVADDGRDASARELRGRIPAALRAGLLHARDERFGSCGETDPAAWHVGDVRIAVVRPSAPDDEAVVSWLDRPDLAWITTTSSEAEIDRVVAAAEAALAERPAAAGERYRPIRATERALDLLRRTRAPATPREQVLMATLPDSFDFTAVVLSTRDDEGDTPIPELIAGAPRMEDLSLVVGPFEDFGSGCSPGARGNSRLEAWAHPSFAPRSTWPCDDPDAWGPLGFWITSDCRYRCEPWAVQRSFDGTAACTVTADTLDGDSCPADHGWRDPMGQPTWVQKKGGRYRRCEVVQLTGPDLEQCRTSLECPGCASGWCATDVPELMASDCYWDTWKPQPPVLYPWPIRFVGGAGVGRAMLTITCDALGG